ncbi:hypothetical protein ID866_5196 [Astraeus odoratus]|nr:hypothetical protein ID866_5196 [Astraeus odoratus]
MSDSTPLSDIVSSSSEAQPTIPSNDDIEAVIRMATASADRPLAPPRDTRTQLFVGNLPYRVRWQDLKDLFRKAGTVLRADVSLGPDNRSRGYGTVLLATAEDAGRAIDMFNGYCWQTRVLEVRPDRLGASPDPEIHLAKVAVSNHVQHSPLGGHINGLHDHPMALPSTDILATNTGMRSLFVGNLPFHIQWQDLKDLFRAAGAVARADVALGPDGRSRGFGTVTFATEDGAERARRLFDGYEYHGRQLKVHYDKFAQSSQVYSFFGVTTQPAPTSSSLLTSFDPLTQPGFSTQLALNQNSLDSIAHPLPQQHIDPALLRAQIESSLAPAQFDQTRPSTLTSPALHCAIPFHFIKFYCAGACAQPCSDSTPCAFSITLAVRFATPSIRNTLVNEHDSSCLDWSCVEVRRAFLSYAFLFWVIPSRKHPSRNCITSSKCLGGDIIVLSNDSCGYCSATHKFRTIKDRIFRRRDEQPGSRAQYGRTWLRRGLYLPATKLFGLHASFLPWCVIDCI